MIPLWLCGIGEEKGKNISATLFKNVTTNFSIITPITKAANDVYIRLFVYFLSLLPYWNFVRTENMTIY